MYLIYHFLIGIVFSLILFLLFPQISILGILIIFLSSLLIDIDHYFYHVHQKKDLNLKNAYSFFFERRKKLRKLSEKNKRKYKKPILVFHGIEFLIILFFLSFFHVFFLYVLIGTTFHLLLDFIEIAFIKGNVSTKISQIHNFFANKNQKRKEFKFQK